MIHNCFPYSLIILFISVKLVLMSLLSSLMSGESFFLDNSAKSLSLLLIKKKKSWFPWFYLMLFPISILFISTLIFIISFLLLASVCSFSSYLRYKFADVRSSFFFHVSLTTINSPHSTVFTAFPKFWYVVFSFVSKCFLISHLISSLLD